MISRRVIDTKHRVWRKPSPAYAVLDTILRNFECNGRICRRLIDASDASSLDRSKNTRRTVEFAGDSSMRRAIDSSDHRTMGQKRPNRRIGGKKSLAHSLCNALFCCAPLCFAPLHFAPLRAPLRSRAHSRVGKWRCTNETACVDLRRFNP